MASEYNHKMLGENSLYMITSAAVRAVEVPLYEYRRENEQMNGA